MRSHHVIGLLFAALMFVGAGVGCKGEQPGTSGASSRRPNLLLLVSDDQGTVLGCYGNTGVQTPELDALAAGGTRFTRAYSPSGVCTPSRSSIYTGLMPARHGATGFQAVNDDVTVWGEYFARAGYRSGLIGKIGAKPVSRFNFDFISRSDKDDADARNLQWHLDELDSFLGEDDGRPWVLVMNFRDSHWPFPTDGAPFGEDSPPPHSPDAVVVPETLTDTPVVRAEIARFYDGLRRQDASVGAIVARLGERGQMENTLGLFTSDNGPPFPFAKTTLFEAGIHMPMIAWGSGVDRGAVRSELVSLVDVLPTFLDAAEYEGNGPAPFNGRSMLPLLRGESGAAGSSDAWRTALFATHDSHRVQPDIPSRSVLMGDWKYTRTWSKGRLFNNLVMATSDTWREMVAAADAGDEVLVARLTRYVQRPDEELFNLSADPFELNNLAGRPEHQQVLEKARELLATTDWLELPSDD